MSYLIGALASVRVSGVAACSDDAKVSARACITLVLKQVDLLDGRLSAVSALADYESRITISSRLCSMLFASGQAKLYYACSLLTDF